MNTRRTDDLERIGARSQGQQQGLEKQGAQQLGTRGAEGGAHGELAGSGHGAGEQEVRQVGAGDEQHEPGEADQHAENARAVVGCHGDVERKGAPDCSGVDGGKVGSEATTKVGDEAVALRAGEGAGATPDEAEPGGATVGRFLFAQTEWAEDVERTQVAPVVQGGGQHAHDLVAFAVDADGAADDVAVTPETILPESVTDDEDAVVAQDGFVGTEAAAKLRFGAEGGKKIGGDAKAAGGVGGLAGFGEVHVRKGVGGNFPVAVHFGLQIEVVGRRDSAPGILRSGSIDAIQSTAVGIGQRAQQHFIDDAERRRVGTDAESERHHGNDGEAGRATQRPDGEAEVTEDGDGFVDQHVEVVAEGCRHRARLFRWAKRAAWQGSAPGRALHDGGRLSGPDTQRSQNRAFSPFCAAPHRE